MEVGHLPQTIDSNASFLFLILIFSFLLAFSLKVYLKDLKIPHRWIHSIFLPLLKCVPCGVRPLPQVGLQSNPLSGITCLLMQLGERAGAVGEATSF